MDRNGLRPMRYTITGDGLLIAGSEAGMVRVDENDDRREGPRRPGPDDRRRSRRGPLLPQPRDHGSAGGPSAFSDWVKNITVIDSLVRNAPGKPASFEREELRRRQLAAGFTHRGPGADPPSHGGGRQGSRRLHGRRHAARRAVRPVSRPASLLPPELQPGHQPADRLAAREPGDDPEDPPRQSRQRAGPG